MRRPRDVSGELRPVHDGVPRRHRFTEPIRVADLVARSAFGVHS